MGCVVARCPCQTSLSGFEGPEASSCSRSESQACWGSDLPSCASLGCVSPAFSPSAANGKDPEESLQNPQAKSGGKSCVHTGRLSHVGPTGPEAWSQAEESLECQRGVGLPNLPGVIEGSGQGSGGYKAWQGGFKRRWLTEGRQDKVEIGGAMCL